MQKCYKFISSKITNRSSNQIKNCKIRIKQPMINKDDNQSRVQEFQIIFEKLNEIKKDNKILFDTDATGASLSESIKGIKEIVESYSIDQQFTTFTRV